MSQLTVGNVVSSAGNASNRFFRVSAAIVPVQSSVVTFTHGLPSAPTIAGVYWEAIVANNGFAIGDRIHMQSVDGDGARQTSVWTSSTEVGYSLPSFPVARVKNGTASFSFDATNWRIYLYAGY